MFGFLSLSPSVLRIIVAETVAWSKLGLLSHCSPWAAAFVCTLDQNVAVTSISSVWVHELGVCVWGGGITGYLHHWAVLVTDILAAPCIHEQLCTWLTT